MKELNETIKSLEENRNGCRVRIKEAMGNANNARCGDFRIKWLRPDFISKPVFDEEALAKEHPEIYSKYIVSKDFTKREFFRIYNKR